MVLKITNAEVHIKDKFTWGQREELTKEMARGVKVTEMGLKEVDSGPTFEAKYKLLEMTIEKIIDDQGNEIQFSKDWMYNLDVEDGEKIFVAVDEIAGGLFGNKKKIVPSSI